MDDRSRRARRHRHWLVAVLSSLVLLIPFGTATATATARQPGAASAARPATAIDHAPVTGIEARPGPVAPNPVGELDCNHYSTIQRSVRADMWCTDLYGNWDGRYYDNWHYIGHDEPDLRYLSNRAGSGDDVTWTEILGADPSAAPTVSSPGHDVTHWFELTPAPWYSMAICDSDSYPQLPCTPESNGNAPSPSCIGPAPCTVYPGAGSAFMELQFYPPGFAPFADATSCDNTHWCAALTIDSFEATEGFSNINTACEEPVNFAFIQRNGVPTGPPSPQLADLASFTPNTHTLLMNPGDKVRIRIVDAPVPGGGGKALTTVIDDLTTGQVGYMQASAANGFMNTSIVNCGGTPYNFQPEYASDGRYDIVPWAALQVNVSTEFETGHFEGCTSLSQPFQVNLGGGVTDTSYNVCSGPYEATAPGQDGGTNPEVGDALCYPAGDTHGGMAPPDEVTGCLANYHQNGDLDFDGSPYWPDWPTGARAGTFPGSFVESPPTGPGGQAYPGFQFQTDVALSEVTTCSSGSPQGCTAPPPNAPGNFYPYWTLERSSAGRCAWEFGNVSSGDTFGKDAQYGTEKYAQYGYPLLQSGIHANSCRA